VPLTNQQNKELRPKAKSQTITELRGVLVTCATYSQDLEFESRPRGQFSYRSKGLAYCHFCPLQSIRALRCNVYYSWVRIPQRTLALEVMTNPIFWDTMSCSLLKVSRRFGVTHRLHQHEQIAYILIGPCLMLVSCVTF
jgi:hypothetical protein